MPEGLIYLWGLWRPFPGQSGSFPALGPASLMKDCRTWVDQASVSTFEASVSLVQTWYLAMMTLPCLRKDDPRFTATSNKSLCSSLFSTNSRFLTKRGSFVLQNTLTPHFAMLFCTLRTTAYNTGKPSSARIIHGLYASEFTYFLKCIYSLQAKNCSPWLRLICTLREWPKVSHLTSQQRSGRGSASWFGTFYEGVPFRGCV